ncbi:MAG: hypothetical protein JSV50_16220 [Desulfobacteraceae bacterium]|nr:MAG: hypothetical protein JSV50_16220 [Desulfobacteraceae bacterium]
MKVKNENSADKEKKSLLSTVDLPYVDKTEDKVENEESDQDGAQTAIPDPVEETKVGGENRDKETIAGGPGETAGTEEKKAHREKAISPDITELPGDEDEGVKTEDQEAVTKAEEELDKEAKEEDKKPYKEADVEENDEGEEEAKRRRRIGPFVMGIILVLLLVSMLFALLIYFKMSKPFISKELSSPEQAVKSEAKFQNKIHKPDHFSLAHEKLTKVGDLIQGLQNKQKAIFDLKQQYQRGISEAEDEILEGIQSNKVANFQDALKDKRVELCLLTIQRRQVYINELERLLDQLVMDLEELIYLKRGIEIDMLMVNVLKGMDMESLGKRIDTIIQRHIQDNDKLTIDTNGARVQPLNAIWVTIYESSQKRTLLSREEIKNREIWKEICSGNFSRKHQITALSLESAKALSEWKGKDLFLVKLTRLSPGEAKYLSKWKGRWLSLNGIYELSPESAKHLSQWKGNRLSLNGLKEVSPEVVEYLSQWQGEELELVSLKNISQWEESGKLVHLPDRHRKPVKK